MGNSLSRVSTNAVNREWTINGESITILSDVLSCDFDGDGHDDLIFFDKNGFDIFLNNGENFKKWDKIQSDEPLCANGEKVDVHAEEPQGLLYPAAYLVENGCFPMFGRI